MVLVPNSISEENVFIQLGFYLNTYVLRVFSKVLRYTLAILPLIFFAKGLASPNKIELAAMEKEKKTSFATMSRNSSGISITFSGINFFFMLLLVFLIIVVILI